MPSFFQEFVDKINAAAVNIDNLTEEELAEFLNLILFSRKKRNDLVHIYLNFNRLEQGEPAEKDLKINAEEAVPFRIALIVSYFKDNQEAGDIFLKNIETIIKKLEKLEKDFGDRGEFLPGIPEGEEENHEILSYQYELLNWQYAVNFSNRSKYSFDPEKYSDIISMMSFLKILDNSREKIVERFRSDSTDASLHTLSLLEGLGKSDVDMVLQTNLREKYKFCSSGEATLINTMSSPFKNVGKTFSNKGKQREEQIAFIERTFDFLINSGFDTEKKAKYAYLMLLKTQKELEEERNVFPSGMNKMCDQLKKELKSALSAEQVKCLENNKEVYQTALQEAVKEIATKRVLQSKKR